MVCRRGRPAGRRDGRHRGGGVGPAVSRVVVELAGPAGAGKTTLVRELQAPRPATTTVGVQVGAPRLAAGDPVGGTSPGGRAACSLRAAGGPATSCAALAYLRRLAASPCSSTHGSETMLLSRPRPGVPAGEPVRVRAADGGLAAPSTGGGRAWPGTGAGCWTSVVYLDAPDDVLLRRIEARPRAHRVRGADQDEATEFLARYRTSYRRALDAVAAAGAQVVEVDTSARRPRQLAEPSSRRSATRRARSPRMSRAATPARRRAAAVLSRRASLNALADDGRLRARASPSSSCWPR